ncbi:ABC transporter related protein [Coriobacterium glomerans PW2]|uniref:ABC transporter related protein n=1 Tax=Coriobacterium glomerans (strain ATCC 49209 / DSM 20642 / JCM 10262 / PW2) TaxID=700015 RepID=F2N7M3_CORGP|nr:ABC transporter ATP-binding protein [Coriobacterium glomerans]AEB06915.1 ABC transporter related protein [Coriobacterium glomerans PW2]
MFSRTASHMDRMEATGVECAAGAARRAPVVEARGLAKSFGGRVILPGLDLRCQAGSVTAITGPSGSGKSTLLDILGLLEAPDAGELTICGGSAPSCASRAATLLRRRSISYLFQSNALVTGRTVMDNLLLALHYTRESASRKRERARRALAGVGLVGAEAAPVSILSGGEQQRVAIARCILKPGELVLADEPTGSLDRPLAREVFGQILSLRDEHGKTVIVVTHDPEIAARCDTTVELSAAAARTAF